jgi:hypothetical protein
VTRPRGEIRQALSLAAQALHEERGAFTWVQVAERAHMCVDQVGEVYVVAHTGAVACRVVVTKDRKW